MHIIIIGILLDENETESSLLAGKGNETIHAFFDS